MIETVYQLPVPVKIAVLPDFHNADPLPVLRSLRDHQPDLITVPGDFLLGNAPAVGSKMSKSLNASAFLSGCATVAPTFVSLGNHEWMLDEGDLEAIRSLGCTVLENGWVVFHGLVIGGLTSARVTAYRRWRGSKPAIPRYPYDETTPRSSSLVPDTAWLSSFCTVPGYHILLCHHPEYWQEIRSTSVELVVSGHAHGGQWRIFRHGIYAPGQGLWPKWTSGVVDGRLVISRGLTNSEPIPRINNPTEIVYLEPQTQAPYLT